MPCPPLMCARQADCGDLRCPGHPKLTDDEFALGLRALHVEDGGTWKTDGHRVLRLRPTAPAESDEERDKRVTTPEEAESWSLPALLFFTVLAVGCAAAVFLCFFARS
jgi:hypothetical protein